MKSLFYTFVIISVLGFSAYSQTPLMTNISGPSAVCSAPSTSANVYTANATNAPTNYIWTITPFVANINGTGSTRSIIFPNTNSTYTIFCYATNASGSSNTRSLVVTVFETPTITFSGNNIFLCQGSSTNLSASSTIIYSASSSLSYTWSPASGLNNTSGPVVTASPSITTNYTIDVKLGSCSNTYQVTVVVQPCLSFRSYDSDALIDLLVFPNPSNGNFFIQSPRNEHIYVLNELGQIIRQLDVIENEKIQIEDLPMGIYFMRGQFTKAKVVVTR